MGIILLILLVLLVVGALPHWRGAPGYYGYAPAGLLTVLLIVLLVLILMGMVPYRL
jgi:hypothetical protein